MLEGHISADGGLMDGAFLLHYLCFWIVLVSFSSCSAAWD